MGSPRDELRFHGDESPQHRVKVSPFFIGRYTVTQAQWRVVAAWKEVDRELDNDPSQYKGENRPVENVTWDDAVEFCARLSRETGRQYQLPSEAMWEYACHAGTQTAFSFGPMISPEVANYDWSDAYDDVRFEQEKTFEGTVSVGHFSANSWGLYEMHGNVWEWCIDHCHFDYEHAPKDGNAWIDDNTEGPSERMVRGGSWLESPIDCRSTTRSSYWHSLSDDNSGFRVVCLPPESTK